MGEAEGATLRLVATRDLAAAAALAERLEAFARDRGCADGAAMQIALVAEELLTNVVKYAWADSDPHTFQILAMARDDGAAIEVTITVEDDGMAFDPLAGPSPDLDAALADRPIGGLGIHFVRTMTDAQSYARVAGRNRLTVVKRCPRALPD
jgi:anti-sigma regulatory factor (Ser/Thr protein kinase)